MPDGVRRVARLGGQRPVGGVQARGQFPLAGQPVEEGEGGEGPELGTDDREPRGVFGGAEGAELGIGGKPAHQPVAPGQAGETDSQQGAAQEDLGREVGPEGGEVGEAVGRGHGLGEDRLRLRVAPERS